jgi:GAF domain-containing protein
MSGQSIVVSDVDQDARFARDIAESTEFIPKSIMAAPLIDAAGEVSGVIEVLDPRTGSEHTGRDLEILGVMSAQLASVVELGQVYDRLGAALIAGLSGSADSAAFGATLTELAASGGADAEFAELAATFNELAAVGPAGLRMAQTVLREVIVFTRSRR